MQVPISQQIERVVEDINALPEQIQQACIYALNRTAELMKSELAKEISAKQRIRLKKIRDKITIMRANKRNPQARISGNLKSVYVKDLDNVHQTPVGVVAGGKVYPHAFIATLRSGGKPGVYRRTTKKRFPVKSVTISVFDDATKIIDEMIGTEARRVFEKRFFHEMKRITEAI